VRKLVKKSPHDKPIPPPHSLAGSHLPFLYQSFLDDLDVSLIAKESSPKMPFPGAIFPL
jgi:hypothetical protein